MIECVNVKSTCLFRIDNKCEHTLKEIYEGKSRNEKNTDDILKSVLAKFQIDSSSVSNQF